HVVQLERGRASVLQLRLQLGLVVNLLVGRLPLVAHRTTAKGEGWVCFEALHDGRSQMWAVRLTLRRGRVATGPDAHVETATGERVVDALAGLRGSEVQDAGRDARTARTNGGELQRDVQQQLAVRGGAAVLVGLHVVGDQEVRALARQVAGDA